MRISVTLDVANLEKKETTDAKGRREFFLRSDSNVASIITITGKARDSTIMTNQFGFWAAVKARRVLERAVKRRLRFAQFGGGQLSSN